MDCICQCTVVLSAYGLYLSVYSCPLSLWTAFVSVQLHVAGDPHGVQITNATTAVFGVALLFLSLSFLGPLSTIC